MFPALLCWGWFSAQIAEAQVTKIRENPQVQRFVPALDPGGTIRFLHSGAEQPAFQPASGWPVTVEVVINEDKLRGFSKAKSFFPFRESGGRIELGGASKGGTNFQPMGSWGNQKAIVEVNPGLSLPSGEATNPATSAAAIGSGPQAFVEGGPFTGSEADGYGFGHSWRFPGLVLVADAGPGILTDDALCPRDPVQAHNLAGFFHSIAYELKNARGRSTLVAHMNVPRGLFAPIVNPNCKLSSIFQSGFPRGDSQQKLKAIERFWRQQSSSPAKEAGEMEGPAGERVLQRQIDIKPQDEPLPDCEEGWGAQYLSQPLATVTLRAFLVDGQSPDVLLDLDGDGVVNRVDAVKAGLWVLSNEATYRVKVWDVSLVAKEKNGGYKLGRCKPPGNLHAGQLEPPPREP